MIITPTTQAGTNPLTNASETQSTVTSTTPFVYVIYNNVTRAIVGACRYCPVKKLSSVGAILACDTYANLQAAVVETRLTGTLSADPTPK